VYWRAAELQAERTTIATIFGNHQQRRYASAPMVRDRVGSLAWLRKRIEDADTELLRETAKAVTEVFMSAEASAVCGAVHRTGGQAWIGGIGATGTVSVGGTHGWERSTWRFPSDAKAATSPSGCWSRDAVLSGRHCKYSMNATSVACPHDEWPDSYAR
jgi:hypothetical protein